MPVKKTQSGTVDKRTKEGKAIAERMAKARAAIGTAKPGKKTAAKTATKTTAKPASTQATKTATSAITKSITQSVLSSLLKTPSKPAASSELSVTGNKKIGTLMKEFNKKFPYLRLGIFYSYAREAVKKGESIKIIDVDKTLASVRRADSGGDISISGNKKIKSLEKEFDTVFGLYCQVCYTEKDGHRYYTSGSNDEKTLAAFNAECEKKGCKKGEWK
ncbi:MAG: hypothetical protein J6T35_02975 [Bacteroidales bacterium]|nr:hypothetical protein [Bacteroidales bacterium]